VLRPRDYYRATTPNLYSGQAKLLFELSNRPLQLNTFRNPTHITLIELFPFHTLLIRHGFIFAGDLGFLEDGNPEAPER